MFINKKAVYLLRINVKSGTMIDKYINPHTDFGFKRLFGSEFSEQDQKLYEDSMNAYRDIVNAIRTAEKKKYAEGEAEGLAKGLVEGRAKGLVEGRAEGRAEGIVEVAKKMLDKGMAAALVAEMTGLPLDEVSNLKQ